MLVLSIAKARGVLFDAYTEAQALYRLPTCAEQVLGSVRDRVYEIAKELRHATNVLFLARGVLYAVSHEGALKLTEVSYIHAQAFPGGELKHGPIALVDDRTPTIALVGNDLPEQMWSNIREIQARDGQVYAFVENGVAIPKQFYGKVLQLPPTPCTLREVLMVIPLQLLAYYVATLRGTNVDQPRNLAKSVTVE
jgi:glucosamine--fructose-6-phosphate aminotransferase (isomerizing)